MSKEEFIQKLRQALAGEVPQSVIEENVSYYSGYISDETGRGQSEEDVIAFIGDPRLIAKSITDSTTVTEDARGYGGDTYTGAGGQAGNPYADMRGDNRSVRTYDMSKWYWKALAVVAVVAVVSLIITIVGGIFSILLPIVIPALIIWFIFSLLRGPRR